MAELFVQRIRGRVNGIGAALQAVKPAWASRPAARCRPRQRRRHRLQPRRGRISRCADLGAAARAVRLPGHPRRRAANYQQLLGELDPS